jgi:hypothetical protein
MVIGWISGIPRLLSFMVGIDKTGCVFKHVNPSCRPDSQAAQRIEGSRVDSGNS